MGGMRGFLGALLPRWGDADSVQDMITMRFKSRGMEEGFLAQRKDPLVRSTKLLLPVPLMIYIVGIILNFAASMHLRSTHHTEDAFISQQVEIISDFVMTALILVFLAFVHCGSLVERVGTLTLEVVVVLFCIVCMLTVTLSTPLTVTKIRGVGLTEAYGEGWYSSDSGLLLKLDIVVTGTHLGPRVRWYLLLPVALVAVSLFMAHVFAIGSDESTTNSIYNSMFLTGLSVVASVSKWIAEHGERQAFFQIIQEKSLRCEAEFKLSQGHVEDVRQRPRSIGDESSVPTVAASAAVFDPMYQDNIDLRDQLQLIADMGDVEHWRINPSEVKMLNNDVLGSGSYGVVSRGLFCGVLVAVKCPHAQLSQESAKKLPGFCNELRVLRRLRHPNIVATHGAIVDPEGLKIAIVLELVQGTMLDAFMAGAAEGQGEGRSTLARYQIMLGVCRALVYMHTRRPRLVHGDIKSNNVMVEVQDGVAHPKLLDFGLSRIVTQGSMPLGGTLAWMPPESLRSSGKVRCSADVYTFGRLLAFVATGIPPLTGLGFKQIREALMAQTVPKPLWPQGCVFTEALKGTVKACLRADPVQRVNILQVHERLLRVPEELQLQDPQGHFLADVLTVRAHLATQDAGEDGVDSPRSPRPPAAAAAAAPAAAKTEQVPEPPPAGPPALQVSSLRNELSSVPEGQAVHSFTTTEGSSKESAEMILYPHKRPTDEDVMGVSLLELMVRWNCKVQGQPCCELHAGARMARQLSSKVLAKSCVSSSAFHLGGQCSNCGMLGYEADVQSCRLCQGRGGAGPPRPSATSTRVML